MKTSIKQILGALACVTLGLGSFGCTPEQGSGQEAGEQDTMKGGKGDQIGAQTIDENEQIVCVGIRGNGSRIFGHFGAMARIHEHYGMILGVAGGSSGSISTFLTESMYANPGVYACGQEFCASSVTGERVALMFKSMEGYAAEVAQSEDAVAFQQLAPIVAKLKAGGVGELIDAEQFEQAREMMLTILKSEEVRSLINPEVLALLQESSVPDFHVKDIWQSVQSFGSFKVEGPDVLIRPGILNFNAFADKIGRIGDFYAGYGPDQSAQWDEFFAQCANQSRGMSWAQASTLVANDTQTCGQLFSDMVTSWRAEAIPNADAYPHRLDERVGKHTSALVTTSLIMGDAVSAWQDARAEYMNGSVATDLGIDFAKDVRLGYWGSDVHLDVINENIEGYDDLKTSMFYKLGAGTYREALSLSPAEPGLARGIEITEGLVSTGGWSDLEPTLVLRNIGCEQIILITREGDTEGFGADVARQLGMTPEQQEALFSTGSDSSVKRSLEQADGVWCTDWDGQGGFDFSAVMQDAYNAPMEVHSDWLTSVESAYENTSQDLNKVGCTPGVSN